MALAGSEHALAPTFCAPPLDCVIRLADSQISRSADKLSWKPDGSAKWDYTAGLFTLSLLKLNESSPDPRYVEFTKAAIGSFITDDGRIRGYNASEYTLDNINPGKTLLALYRITHEERYSKAAALLRRQLDSQPRTSDGGFWHKQRYPHQMWLGGLYMATPFYAEYAQLHHEPAASFDDIAKQFRLIAAHTYDPASGLFYHGWDEAKQQPWANPVAGTSSNFWGRAIGWYGMALVDVLDFVPTNHPARSQLIADLQRFRVGVLRHQDAASGLWNQVMDRAEAPGNYLEATASSMFIYTLAKGVNRGYFSRDCVPAIRKGWNGLTETLLRTDANGQLSLTHCCSVAGLGYGRDGSYQYYIKEPIIDNDLKGVGPFILAGIELQKLFGP